jgi:hypothetical protein
VNEYLSTWFDVVDHSPGIICEVELSNGARMEAIMVMGSRESLDRKTIYPILFRLKRATVFTPLYMSGEDTLF